MHSLVRLLGTSTLIRLTSATASAGPMTADERQRLLAHFEMTEAWLVSEVEPLSETQLNFRMTPDSWSVKDVVEHLAVAEPQYWQQVQDGVKQPLGYKSERTTDAVILWYGVDRTHRKTTGEARVAHGQFPSAKESLAAFRKLRSVMTQFASDSQEDVRGRQLKGGDMDVYQWLLMISTHSQRHIMQIREIKAHAGYPKSEAGGPTSVNLCRSGFGHLEVVGCDDAAHLTAHEALAGVVTFPGSQPPRDPAQR